MPEIDKCQFWAYWIDLNIMLIMRRRELGLEVIDAMKTKISSLSLSLPKGYGVSPVLLHLGPVSDTLLSSRYFYRIIDIADL